MAIAAARSKSLPFLDQPKALDGTLPGDVGFDPLNLSGIEVC
jgi:light-harvesting complex I chlorophyll a/b binding protein 1